MERTEYKGPERRAQPKSAYQGPERRRSLDWPFKPVTDAQREAATASKRRLQQRFNETIVVKISAATTFYPAEAYHQDYHTRNSVRYRFYRWSCGRDARLKEIWGEG